MSCYEKLRASAIETLVAHHYTHSVPSGKSHYHTDLASGAIVVFSIPANKNINGFLGCKNVWELSRLWAPDGHEKNLLTRVLAERVRLFHKEEPTCEALVSYADPNVGHEGFIYRAASWVFLGQCEEGRVYYRGTEMRPRRPEKKDHVMTSRALTPVRETDTRDRSPTGGRC